MNGQKQGDYTTFLVTCDGACQNIHIFLKVDSGDPELFGQEHSTPVILDRNCGDCSSVCASRAQSGKSEYCEISTLSNTFHVMVYAYEAYGNSSITFQNVLSVEEYGNY